LARTGTPNSSCSGPERRPLPLPLPLPTPLPLAIGAQSANVTENARTDTSVCSEDMPSGGTAEQLAWGAANLSLRAVALAGGALAAVADAAWRRAASGGGGGAAASTDPRDALSSPDPGTAVSGLAASPGGGTAPGLGAAGPPPPRARAHVLGEVLIAQRLQRLLRRLDEVNADLAELGPALRTAGWRAPRSSQLGRRAAALAATAAEVAADAEALAAAPRVAAADVTGGSGGGGSSSGSSASSSREAAAAEPEAGAGSRSPRPARGHGRSRARRGGGSGAAAACSGEGAAGRLTVEAVAEYTLAVARHLELAVAPPSAETAPPALVAQLRAQYFKAVPGAPGDGGNGASGGGKAGGRGRKAVAAAAARAAQGRAQEFAGATHVIADGALCQLYSDSDAQGGGPVALAPARLPVAKLPRSRARPLQLCDPSDALLGRVAGVSVVGRPRLGLGLGPGEGPGDTPAEGPSGARKHVVLNGQLVPVSQREAPSVIALSLQRGGSAVCLWPVMRYDPPPCSSGVLMQTLPQNACVRLLCSPPGQVFEGVLGQRVPAPCVMNGLVEDLWVPLGR
jgi:hypothetical protein